MQIVRSLFFLPLFFVAPKAASQQRLRSSADSATHPLSLTVLPQNFYKQSLPFSCKSELHLQKLTSLPLYFRLGSKEYVDYLEKKPNAAGNRP